MACTCGFWPKDVGWETHPICTLHPTYKCFQLSMRMTLIDDLIHSSCLIPGCPLLVIVLELINAPHLQPLQASLHLFMMISDETMEDMHSPDDDLCDGTFHQLFWHQMSRIQASKPHYCYLWSFSTYFCVILHIWRHIMKKIEKFKLSKVSYK